MESRMSDEAEEDEILNESVKEEIEEEESKFVGSPDQRHYHEQGTPSTAEHSSEGKTINLEEERKLNEYLKA
jgi:hypothetical protein